MLIRVRSSPRSTMGATQSAAMPSENECSASFSCRFRSNGTVVALSIRYGAVASSFITRINVSASSADELVLSLTANVPPRCGSAEIVSRLSRCVTAGTGDYISAGVDTPRVSAALRDNGLSRRRGGRRRGAATGRAGGARASPGTARRAA